MVQCGYNPQEVLSPLMQRFGRRMHCGRAEGFSRMVSTVSEDLHIDRTAARRLVQQLASAGLIDFESDSAGESRYAEALVGVAAGADESPASSASLPGVWRIGPCT